MTKLLAAVTLMKKLEEIILDEEYDDRALETARQKRQPASSNYKERNDPHIHSDKIVGKDPITDAQQNIAITAGPQRAQQGLDKTYQRRIRRVADSQENRGSIENPPCAG